MSIYQLINDIESGDVVLPAIQRDFVWDDRRIYKLFDSLLRGYPVGIALLWETHQPMQFRKFDRNYNKKLRATYEDNKIGKRIRLVLDGQQRLSSLYLALKGTLNGAPLFFDVLSGRVADDHSEVKFNFKFIDLKEARSLNIFPPPDEKNQMDKSLGYWVRLSEIIGKAPSQLLDLRKLIQKKVMLNEDDSQRLELNILNVNYALCDNGELLKTQTIDSNLPVDDTRRKTPFDILEIFVRVNTSGMNLRRSDLIISMLRLYWGDASDLVPKFIDEVNDRSNIQIDNDFVIRCLFSVSGLGTRLDFDLLRKQTNVNKIKANVLKVFKAIKACMDFIRIDCGIDSGRLLGGVNCLVPLVYSLAISGLGAFSKENKSEVRSATFLFAFSKVFTQHVDSRPGAFIRECVGSDGCIKFATAARFVSRRSSLSRAPDEFLFSNNKELAFSLLQKRTGSKPYVTSNNPEIDHIFPQSVLYEKGWDETTVNDIGNLWILPKGMNGSKSASAPAKYFADFDEKVLEAAFIDKNLLTYGKYKTFITARKAKLVSELQNITGLPSELFAFLDDEQSAPVVEVE